MPESHNTEYRRSWGRGIDLIREACAAHGAPEPEFRWDGGLWVEFPFGAEHVLPETQETTQKRPETLGEKLRETLGNTPARCGGVNGTKP